MMKSLRLLSFAALLTTGTAAMSMAATDASQEFRLAASNRICRLRAALRQRPISG